MFIIYDKRRASKRWYCRGRWMAKPPECGDSYVGLFTRWLFMGCPGTILEMKYALPTYYQDMAGGQ